MFFQSANEHSYSAAAQPTGWRKCKVDGGERNASADGVREERGSSASPDSPPVISMVSVSVSRRISSLLKLVGSSTRGYLHQGPSSTKLHQITHTVPFCIKIHEWFPGKSVKIIHTRIEWVLFWLMSHPSSKFSRNLFSCFCIFLLTYQETNKQHTNVHGCVFKWKDAKKI